LIDDKKRRNEMKKPFLLALAVSDTDRTEKCPYHNTKDCVFPYAPKKECIVGSTTVCHGTGFIYRSGRDQRGREEEREG
jgi:hypothetical protein